MALYWQTLNNVEMFFLPLSLKTGTGEVRRSYATQPCLLPNSKHHSFSIGRKLSDFLW